MTLFEETEKLVLWIHHFIPYKLDNLIKYSKNNLKIFTVYVLTLAIQLEKEFQYFKFC